VVVRGYKSVRVRWESGSEGGQDRRDFACEGEREEEVVNKRKISVREESAMRRAEKKESNRCRGTIDTHDIHPEPSHNNYVTIIKPVPLGHFVLLHVPYLPLS
jgi:hypothetical protein